jgi:hypothetical protein
LRRNETFIKEAFVKKVLAALFLVLLLAAQYAYAGDGAELAEARAVFQKALAGKGATPEEALGRFNAFIAKEPGNTLYEAYAGACMTIQGRDAWFPWKKISYTEQGLDKIEAAVARTATLAGDDLKTAGIRLETKLVAARTYLTVPDYIFHRAVEGKKLLLEISRSPEYEKMGEDFKNWVKQSLSEIKEKG